MKKLGLILGLCLLMFCVACGTSSTSVSVPPGTGSFSNSSLSGQYVYQLTGEDFTNGAYFREAGVFTADGNGHITGGEDDLNENGFFPDTTSGSYSISNDGIGTLTLNFSSGGTLDCIVSMADTTKAYLLPADNGASFPLNGNGVAEKQSATSLSASTFAFVQHNLGSSAVGAYASAGEFTVSGGGITGTADTLRGGVASTVILTGLLGTPDSSGRGTGAFIDAVNGTSNFSYYVVDGNNLRLLESDATVLGLGRAEAQSGGPFSNASFVGSYAFGTHGDDAFPTLGAVNTVGAVTADGTVAGNIAGTYDSTVDDTSLANVPLTGTYSVDGSGRVAATLNSGALQQVYWLVNPSRAFMLTTADTSNTSKVEDGTMDLQVGPFSNAALNGQFAMVMDGFNDFTGSFFSRAGTLKWDGNTTVTLNEETVDSIVIGVGVPGLLTGTYAVGSNGRGTSTITGTTNNVDLVFYLTSANDGYVLQSDTLTALSGRMGKQP